MCCDPMLSWAVDPAMLAHATWACPLPGLASTPVTPLDLALLWSPRTPAHALQEVQRPHGPVWGASPPPRLDHVAFALPGGRVLVFGGSIAGLNPAASQVYLLDPGEDKPRWRELALPGQQPKIAWGHSTCVLGGTKAVVLGGQTGKEWVLNELHELSILSSAATAPPAGGAGAQQEDRPMKKVDKERDVGRIRKATQGEEDAYSLFGGTATCSEGNASRNDAVADALGTCVVNGTYGEGQGSAEAFALQDAGGPAASAEVAKQV
eukprot:TRINITY_DN22250_c4_g1_i2.p1 TRINITY_DN22250_c4_g1~~TRINITY_DN22250_c4_g1_i2.p1  ORF type:complete len:265 (-),score=4.53 TRINITY_DN22250_c4_g1_i2:142-936(-)